MFARWGICDKIIIDNGPQFSSDEFRKFAEDYGFEHVTSSPSFPQSNGEAERAVQIAKNILRQDDIFIGLMTYKMYFYIAQYPVRWTAQSSLHFLPSLTDLFIPTPNRLLREAFQPGSNYAPRLNHSHFHHTLELLIQSNSSSSDGESPAPIMTQGDNTTRSMLILGSLPYSLHLRRYPCSYVEPARLLQNNSFRRVITSQRDASVDTSSK